MALTRAEDQIPLGESWQAVFTALRTVARQVETDWQYYVLPSNLEHRKH